MSGPETNLYDPTTSRGVFRDVGAGRSFAEVQRFNRNRRKHSSWSHTCPPTLGRLS